MASSLTKPAFWYVFCNHWTQGGIGYSFPFGWHQGKRYQRNFSTIYTIEKMLDATEEWPGLVAGFELDAFAYEQLALEGGETLARLKTALRERRAGIEGGTYGQPLGQDFGAESNLRQLNYGRAAILETLDYPVHCFLVEEQWFHPQLPQLLRSCGYRYACLQSQNCGQVAPMNKDVIAWAGVDGTVIPAIPANELQVSCVRQYTDYQEYLPRLSHYSDPLLFQWVEIWPPGMDWGASATPFAKAIADMMAQGGKPTTLQDYFAAILPGRTLETIFIPLDHSNYNNSWYQAGGWGYDGDRVIQLDAQAEHTALALETLAAITQASIEQGKLDAYWRRLLVLQNHDFSVARNYQMWTDDGLLTENGYFAQAGYRKLTGEMATDLQQLAGEDGPQAFFNHTDLGGDRVFAPAGHEPLAVTLVPMGWVAATGPVAAQPLPVPSAGGAAHIGDARFDIAWKPGSWEVALTDRKTGVTLHFSGVSGRIGKLNEHDSQVWPALSPGHETFSFAFDGAVHAPDQVAANRVEALVEQRGPVRSTLRLSCDLLTLHTSKTPVARAEIRVHLNHQAATIELEIFLYAGVWIGLESCRAIFRHDIHAARLFRDYPFGEAQAQTAKALYPLSYTRLAGNGAPERGVQIIHNGARRAFYEPDDTGGCLEYLLARSKIRGEYHFAFTVIFGPSNPSLAARRARFYSAPLRPLRASALARHLDPGESFVACDNPAIHIAAVFSTAHLNQGMSQAMARDHGGAAAQSLPATPHLIIRLVNFSSQEQLAKITAKHPHRSARRIEASGWIIGDADLQQGISLAPHAIITLALPLDGG